MLLIILSFYLSSLLHQVLAQGQVTSIGCPMEWRISALIPGIDQLLVLCDCGLAPVQIALIGCLEDI